MKLKRVLKYNDNGDDVKFLQEKLKEHGFYRDKINGIYGQTTMQSVTSFQKKNSIKLDGEVGLQTWNKLLNYNKIEGVRNNSPKLEIDFKESYLTIYKGSDNKSDKKTLKNTIFLFINNTSSRPDLALNKIKSHYIIGRKSSSSNDELWDGKILKSMDDKYYLNNFENSLINERSIFIEICNYGELILKDEVFYNSFNKPILNKEDVIKINNKFYEKITDSQIESLINLIKYLKLKWNIDFNIKINEDWFEYNESWFSLGGLRTLGQVIKNKSDLFPQENLIIALNSI